jgi:DNA-binding transcriptional MerR regulator
MGAAERPPRPFTAGDVRKATGLSSRQLNDWDERGALPHNRDGEAGWRRFTLREVFVLLVCVEFRKQLGIPVERLRFVREFMLQDGANHLKAAIDLMAILGVNIWLLTDFEKTFVMDSELEFQDMFRHGFFSAPGKKGFALLNVSPLVTRLTATLKEPLDLPLHGRGFEILRQMEPKGAEHRVLELIRSGDYRKIEIETKSGEIKTIKKSRRVDDESRIAALLDEHDFQKVTVTTQGGKVVHIEQASTEKP